MDRELRAKVQKIAKQAGLTVSAQISLWAFEKTLHISLAPEDFDQIKSERAAYLKRIDRRTKR